MKTGQLERYMVEQYKPAVGKRPGMWVPIGSFPAVDAREARHLGRGATAQPLRFLRATLIGMKRLAPEGVML